VFWGYVEPESSQDTVFFSIQNPKEAGTAEAASGHAGTPAA